jgi:hypothetical protein
MEMDAHPLVELSLGLIAQTSLHQCAEGFAGMVYWTLMGAMMAIQSLETAAVLHALWNQGGSVTVLAKDPLIVKCPTLSRWYLQASLMEINS